jgi:hypothetical protein
MGFFDDVAGEHEIQAYEQHDQFGDEFGYDGFYASPKSITCKFCGVGGFSWRRAINGRWILEDKSRAIHQCLKHNKKLDVKQKISQIANLPFVSIIDEVNRDLRIEANEQRKYH